MCGILGIVAQQRQPIQEALNRLQRMEYRGYDSFGVWDGKNLLKKVGEIGDTQSLQSAKNIIGHTRWATHGKVCEENAHPHRAGKVTIVHNGIIENHEELRQKSEQYASQTDSEVIAHYINSRLRTQTIEDILPELIQCIQGTFAILVMIDDDERVFAMKRSSPLILARNSEIHYLSSDIYAINDAVKEITHFEDEEWAIITASDSAFFIGKKRVEKRWSAPAVTKQHTILRDHDHFMHQEMHESPIVSRALITSLHAEQQGALMQIHKVLSKSRVLMVGCGSAYYSSLLGAICFARKKIDARAVIASEFTDVVAHKRGLLIATSQSGETMDTIKAVKAAHHMNVTSILNTPLTTIERLSQLTISTRAGHEVAVASTKSFLNQAIVFLSLAKERVENIPEYLQAVLSMEDQIIDIAQRLYKHDNLYVLGCGMLYPIACEIALKLKEVAYVHAEGMMAGELKHGTIALIEEGTPIIGLMYNDQIISSLEEVRSRGAQLTTIGIGGDILLDCESEATCAIASALAGQLLAYHIARFRGCPIDKPRNLAKSVTV